MPVLVWEEAIATCPGPISFADNRLTNPLWMGNRRIGRINCDRMCAAGVFRGGNESKKDRNELEDCR